MQSPQVTIMGAGAIGCYIGGHLLAAGISTRLLGRQRFQEVLQNHGLTISHYNGTQQHLGWEQLRYETDPQAALADVEIILLAVKSQDTSEAAALIKAHAPASAIVVSFQNGVSNPQVLRKHLPGRVIIPGLVPFNVVHDQPGRFHCGTEGELTIEQSPPHAALLQALFAKAKLPLRVAPQLQQEMWTKLLMNLNNPINALAGIPLREELEQRLYRKILAACIDEALVLIKASGIRPIRVGKVLPSLLPSILRLPNWLFSRIAASMLKIDPQARSSMWQDLEAKKSTEIDYINGEILALAQTLQRKAPVNQAVVDAIHDAETRQEGSPHLTAETLWQYIQSK